MFMERCAYCGVIHYPRKYPSVYIGGHYYCKPSCCNQHRKEMTDEIDAASDVLPARPGDTS